MRHKLHGIDIDERSRRLGDGRQGLHIIDRTGEVAGIVESEKTGAGAEQLAQILGLDAPAFPVEGQPLHIELEIFREQKPG